eukprot:GFKZ01008848.1.p1 GENE.GFKZ01008848.1~~GFKZ01008848.1.p1  ORF type:complete len:571 (-),score=84.30 GFKZ01008848.1:501-2213(-)
MPSLKSVSLALLALTSFTSGSVSPVANNPADQSLVSDAVKVLSGNWVESMNSTLPSPNLYPHQWSWDSAFIALGYSHYDTRKAVDETNALFRAQWSNGLLPHIVFNPNALESYFPGPTFWKIETSPSHPVDAQSSGIIQPPVHAIASLGIYKNARTAAMKKLAREHLEEIYPKLVLWHDYLYNERDPLNEGLVFIRHMWESGMDNSPAWDAALERIDLKNVELPEYKRVDKGKVGNHNERPTSFFYDRAVYLIKLFYDNNYNEATIFDKSPFVIQDVLFNSILARAGEALADIADVLGKPEEATKHRDNAMKTSKAITNKLYDPETKYFYDFDVRAGELIKKRISGGLVALYGADISENVMDGLVEHMYSEAFHGKDLSAWTIPSVARDDPAFTNTRYWAGPAWINVNYLVRDGLIRNARGNVHALKLAKYLQERSIEMVRKVGFYEYFDPESGSAHGGHEFSWTAALIIDWLCQFDGKVTEAVGVSEFSTTMTGSGLFIGLILAFLAYLKGSSKVDNAVEEQVLEEIDLEPPTPTKRRSSISEAQAQMGLTRASRRASASSHMRRRARD